MTKTSATKKNAAKTVATALCLCASFMTPSPVSGFTSAPINGAGTQLGPMSLPISRLQVSVSTGSAPVVDNNDDSSGSLGSSNSAQLEAKRKTVSSENQVNWDWKAVVPAIWKLDRREVILFDGECGLCNGGVNMLLDMDTSNNFRFCSLTSNFGKSLLVAHGKDPDDRNSIIVVSPVNPDAKTVQSTILQKSEAVMRIASKLEGAPAWVKAMTTVGTAAPAAVSDWLLQMIADNRHRVNVGEEYDQCRLDFDGEFDGRFLHDYEHEHLFEPTDEEKLRKKHSDIIYS